MNHKAEARRAGPRLEKEVWAPNLKDEVRNLSDAAENYPFIAIEAHIPTVVASPTGPFGSYLEYNYSMMKCNVDLNHALNISFSLSDAKGARPKGVSTWRFNFLFDPHKDFFAQEYLEQMYSRDRLQTHESQGIRCEDFGELLLGTGLVLTEENSYIAFSCESGLSEPSRPRGQGNRPFCEPPERRFHGLYCFSYLLRILMSQELPNDVRSFYEALDMFFPRRCDLADNLQLLHHLCQHDQGDPLRRPYFCNAQACLDGFFRLPEAIRKQSFDRTKPQIEAPAAGRASRRHRRRSKGEKEEEKGTNGTLVNGHGAEARNGLAAPEPSWQ